MNIIDLRKNTEKNHNRINYEYLLNEEIKDYIEIYHVSSYDDLELDEKAKLAAFLQMSEINTSNESENDWINCSQNNISQLFCFLLASRYESSTNESEKIAQFMSSISEALVEYHNGDLRDKFNRIYNDFRAQLKVKN